MKKYIYILILLVLTITTQSHATKYAFIDGKLVEVPSAVAIPLTTRPISLTTQPKTPIKSKYKKFALVTNPSRNKPPLYTLGEALASCIPIQSKSIYKSPFLKIPSQTTTNIYPKNKYCHLHSKTYQRVIGDVIISSESICAIPLEAKSDLLYLAKINDIALNNIRVGRFSF